MMGSWVVVGVWCGKDGWSVFNPFWETGQRALDALATSDPSMTREAQGGCRHGVSGDRAVQRDHTTLS